MGIRDRLQKLSELPKLPGHRSKLYRDVEFRDFTVRLHKATSDRTIPVSAKLLSLLGEELYQMIAHSDDESGRAGVLAGLLEVDFDDEVHAKNAFVGMVLPVLYERMSELTADSGPGSIAWYFERILSGNVEYEGHRAESMEELDAMGFGITELTRLFWVGISLALFPSQGDPDTSTGDRDPESPEKSPPTETSSISGASAKMTGPRAPTSMTAG